MKETTKMSRAVGQLEKMYNTLNADLFGDELPMPIITVQSKPGTKADLSATRGERESHENAERRGTGRLLQRGGETQENTVSDTGSQRADHYRTGQAKAQKPDIRPGTPGGGMAAAQWV